MTPRHAPTTVTARTTATESLDALPLVGLFFIMAIGTWWVMSLYFFDWPIAEDFLLTDWYRRLLTPAADEMSLLSLVTYMHGPHPVGFAATLVMCVFYVIGLNFLAVEFLTFLLVAAGCFLLFHAGRPSTQNRWILAGLLISCFLISFHPVQAHDILWPFQIAWFLISFALSLNIWLIERFGPRALPFVAFISFAACFCSAHGFCVWAASAFHIWLLRGWSDRTRFAWLTFFFGGFIAGASAVTLHAASTGETIMAESVMGLPSYVLSLLGGMFGLRVVGQFELI